MIWVHTYSSPEMNIYTLDGINWYDATVPSRWHRCQPWTLAIDHGNIVERCACGAIRVNNDRWAERNSVREVRR